MVNEVREQEVWKTYSDYPWIEVSNLGRVRTKDRYVRNGKNSKRLIKRQVLKQWDNGRGYLRVRFCVNSKQINLYVHRMVAVCFILNPNNYLEVNHKDNNPTNNRWDNLEWCTREYNIAYKEKYGVSAAEALGRPVIAVNRETFEVFWFESQREAARQLDIDQRQITRVVNGKRNKTHGFWFCNADENAVENTRAKFGDKVAEKVEKLMM